VCSSPPRSPPRAGTGGRTDAYTILDLDRHPVALTGRGEHFRCASAAFAAYGRPRARPADPPPATDLADPAYADPLLIHIAALLRTVDVPTGCNIMGAEIDRRLDGSASRSQPPRVARLRVSCLNWPWRLRRSRRARPAAAQTSDPSGYFPCAMQR